MSEATIHLVTVLYRSRDCLDAFIDSLAQQSADWRLTAVDNAAGDGAAEALERRGDARITLLRNAANLGFARAANQGFRAALAQGAEFVVLINNDVTLPADFLHRFADARAELRAEVLAPRIMRQDRPDEAWYAGGHFAHDWVFRNIHEAWRADDTQPRTVEFASGCCLGLTRRVLQTVGLLDERFFVYWEDTDYCLRLGQGGVAIHYVPDLVIGHEGGHASGGENSAGFNRLYWCSYVQVLRKHFGLAAAARMALRVALKEAGRRPRHWRRLRALLLALARGFVAPHGGPANAQ